MIIGYTTTTAGPNNRHMRYLTRHKDNENMAIYIYTSLSLCRVQGKIILTYSLYIKLQSQLLQRGHSLI